MNSRVDDGTATSMLSAVLAHKPGTNAEQYINEQHVNACRTGLKRELGE